MKEQRFDKIISSQFNISRKDARIGIRRGKGTVDGVVIKDPSAQVSPDAQISYDGQALQFFLHQILNPFHLILLLLNNNVGHLLHIYQ